MEHIKPTSGFKGYFADDKGNIYSKWGRGLGGNKLKDKMHKLNPVKGHNGYLFLSIKVKRNTYKRCGVHQLVCLAFHGLPPSKNYEVSHLDGSRDNNKPDNLCWETRSDNHKRKLIHGTHDRGYLNSRAKIDKRTLDKIRNLLSEKKLTHKEIGELFGLNRPFISKIKGGFRYKNV